MTSKAQLKAIRRYDKKTYKAITCKCKIAEYDTYKQYGEAQGIESMSALLNKCVRYCMENNIDLSGK